MAQARVRGEPPVIDRNFDPGNGNRITTVTQLYNQDESDPYHRDYTRIMTRFNAALPNAVPSATLYQQVVSRGGQTPQAYLFCADTLEGPRVYCIHCPSKFLGALDGTETPWDDSSFGFLGDVIRGLIFLIYFLNNAFETAVTWAHTTEYILQHLQDIQAIPVFPPALPDADDNTISDVTTSRDMFLPHIYIPLLLSACGYTVHQLWDILYPAIVQHHDLEACAPLVQWMRATCENTGILGGIVSGYV
jgi:hypothetical protein